MSLKAMLWVMERAPVRSHTELAVLYALADRADDTGDAAWPAQDWIADRARCSVRTVRRTLGTLETRGLIRHGDQRHVAHIRADRRPTVWKLNLHLDRHTADDTDDTAPGTTPATGHNDRPSDGADHPTTGHNDRADTEPRPDRAGRTTGQGGSNDRTGRVERPDTAVSDEPSLTHQNPPRTIPPLSPQGDDGVEVLDEHTVESSAEPTTLATTPTPGRDLVREADVGTDHTRGRRLAENWVPSPKAVERIRHRYPGMTRDVLEREFEKFQNHWLSSSGANARKRDWDRTWINWMHTAVDRMPPRDRTAMTVPHGQPVTTPGAPSKQQQAHDIAAQLAAEFAAPEVRS